MSTGNVELDFFAMENHGNASASVSKSQRQSLFRRQRSLKDIQSAISKIKPEILKSVISSGSMEHRSVNGSRIAPKYPSSFGQSLEGDDHLSLPVHSPTSRMIPETASHKFPLTIFYNETVAVFHVSGDEAENILTFAEKGSSTGKGEVEKGRSKAAIPSNHHQQLVDVVDAQDEDLPMARKRSLQIFLEKRKDR